MAADRSYGSWELDASTMEAEWSPELCAIFGVDEGFVATRDGVSDLIHPEDRGRVLSAIERAALDGTPLHLVHRAVRPDGVERLVELRAAAVADRSGRARRFVGTVEDISDRRKDSEQLWILANHDALTGLFNRRRFLEELERELSVAARRGTPGAVLMLDLDRFKAVNDVLGHHSGDELLVRVAGMLRSRLRSTDVLARLGGDEFALVLPACTAEQAGHVAEQILATVREGARVSLGHRDFGVVASIGIAPYTPSAETTVEQLLAEADLAMYRAKGDGGDRFAIFDREMRSAMRRRVRIEAELEAAIGSDEMSLHYQPITSIGDGAVVGCEALLRWRHPTRGLVPPLRFIPVAEETGLINPLGAWVAATAIAEAAAWRRRGRNLVVTINVSPRQLIEQDVVGLIGSELERNGLPGGALMIEITETSLLRDADRIGPRLEELRRLGVRVAIDDFGSGASSLSFLRLLPIDVIKVDRLFVASLPESSEDRAIVAAVISLAAEMGMRVIAEGVERESQHAELEALGCPYGQGFLYARPAPPSELRLDGYVREIGPGLGDPSMVREFMRQIGIPVRVGQPDGARG